MRKIDLDELYGGSWEWIGQYGEGEGKLEIKPLREHLQEWVKTTDYRCIRENKQEIQDILDGKDLYLSDDAIGFGYSAGDGYGGRYEDEVIYMDYDEVQFTPFSIIKNKIRDKAREQGIMPPKTWYREEVDRIAYQATHPYDIDVDNLPF